LGSRSRLRGQAPPYLGGRHRLLASQIVWILEGEMVREDACEPGLDDSTATIGGRDRSMDNYSHVRVVIQKGQTRSLNDFIQDSGRGTKDRHQRLL